MRSSVDSSCFLCSVLSELSGWTTKTDRDAISSSRGRRVSRLSAAAEVTIVRRATKFVVPTNLGILRAAWC